MFINFFFELKKAHIPVSLREFLTLLEAMDAGVAGYSVEYFVGLDGVAMPLVKG